MNPLYFGSSRQPLFGIYHPARSRPVRTDGVVICYPMGIEYMRTHRLLRQLAKDLAERGHHVLRFDYYGTGDSAGRGEEVRLSTWLANVLTAVDELRALAAVPRVSLIGVRLGATLAFQVSHGLPDVDRLVMWDPIVNGRRHVDSLAARASASARQGNGQNGGTRQLSEADGYPLPRELLDELAGIDLTAADAVLAREVCLITTALTTDLQTLAERLPGGATRVRCRHFPDPGLWDDPRRLGRAVIAPAAAREIVACLS